MNGGCGDGGAETGTTKEKEGDEARNEDGRGSRYDARNDTGEMKRCMRLGMRREEEADMRQRMIRGEEAGRGSGHEAKNDTGRGKRMRREMSGDEARNEAQTTTRRVAEGNGGGERERGTSAVCGRHSAGSSPVAEEAVTLGVWIWKVDAPLARRKRQLTERGERRREERDGRKERDGGGGGRVVPPVSPPPRARARGRASHGQAAPPLSSEREEHAPTCFSAVAHRVTTPKRLEHGRHNGVLAIQGELGARGDKAGRDADKCNRSHGGRKGLIGSEWGCEGDKGMRGYRNEVRRVVRRVMGRRGDGEKRGWQGNGDEARATTRELGVTSGETTARVAKRGVGVGEGDEAGVTRPGRWRRGDGARDEGRGRGDGKRREARGEGGAELPVAAFCSSHKQLVIGRPRSA
ncbi:Protein of unknown function [Gryllus bimaculatus]|nr:Protein of unknown function [Gryllus bimaculatus]